MLAYKFHLCMACEAQMIDVTGTGNNLITKKIRTQKRGYHGRKENILTEEGLAKLEDELQDLKVNRRKEVAAKIKEAREQGDLSENAEYDAAKDEQRY